jgi:biopolymer transport protein ExbB
MKFKTLYMIILVGTLLINSCAFAQAQGNGKDSNTDFTLYEVIVDGGFVSILIWLMLFAVGAIALLVGVYCFHILRKNSFASGGVVQQVSELMRARNWPQIAELCRQREGVYSKTILNILSNIGKSEQAAADAASDTISKFTRSIARHIGTLQMCGNIAPMLGLLGTVTGMVSAFIGLGGTVGAEKASVLAISISQALYTTAAGLLIAVPALAAAHFARNLLEHRTVEVTEMVEQSASEIWIKAK